MKSSFLYTREVPFEEKLTWVLGIAAVVSYAVYLVVVLLRARETALVDVAYVAPMLWAIGGSLIASIVATIAVAIVSRDNRSDQRDREIDREGNRIGNAFVMLGAVGALVLAMADREPFWIANILYLGFTLAAVVGTTTKIIAYRRGFWPW